MGHPFRSVWANDFNRYCTESYNANFGDHCVFGDIVELLEDTEKPVPKADVVIGGPPCQGFSLLNKGRAVDLRKQLWRPFLDIVARSDAQVFVIENVPHILGTPEHREILTVAEDMGFKTWHGKLCSADYGVPQVRWRAFIIGSRSADPALIFPPLKSHFNPVSDKIQLTMDGLGCEEYLSNCVPWRTVKDVIDDLPPPEGTQIRDVDPPLDLHFGRNPTEKSIARYEAVPDEGMNRFDLQDRAPELTPLCWIRKKSGGTDLFGRLWWDRPAFTIRTEFYKPEKGRYLHPHQHRPITHREAARFQGFPDDFVFHGTKIEVAKQIGNAVPPPLAARVADLVVVLLSGAMQRNGRL